MLYSILGLELPKVIKIILLRQAWPETGLARDRLGQRPAWPETGLAGDRLGRRPAWPETGLAKLTPDD
jgi:hypothetical protein